VTSNFIFILKPIHYSNTRQTWLQDIKEVLSKLLTLRFGNRGIHFRFTLCLEHEIQSNSMYNFAFKNYRSRKCGLSCKRIDFFDGRRGQMCQHWCL